MAAIDPDEASEQDDTSKAPRATLKLVRPPPGVDLEESDEEIDSDEDSDDEEVNGGPSDKERARKLREAAALKDIEDAMEDDDDEDDDDEEDDEGFDLKAAISKLIKGKAPANDDDDDEDEEGSDDDFELNETVICTLDLEKVCYSHCCSL